MLKDALLTECWRSSRSIHLLTHPVQFTTLWCCIKLKLFTKLSLQRNLAADFADWFQSRCWCGVLVSLRQSNGGKKMRRRLLNEARAAVRDNRAARILLIGLFLLQPAEISPAISDEGTTLDHTEYVVRRVHNYVVAGGQHSGIRPRACLGFFIGSKTTPQAVWAYSSGCSLRGPLTYATSIHRSPPCWLAPPNRPTSSVLASNNRVISNRSTLDFTLHCGERRIVLPGDASWKRLCSSSSVPPDDDDDETAVGDIHQPFFYRYNTFENLCLCCPVASEPGSEQVLVILSYITAA